VNLLNTFFSTIRQTEFTPDLKNLTLACYAKGRTLAEASVQLASELFGFLNPRLFNPFDGEFRKFTQPILLKEARRTPDGEQCNCFCMVGKQRKAIFRKGDGFHLRDNTRVDPEKYELAPNVKTRSVCQDAYFNTHTYVAGPGEVKYLAEMDGAYEFHGVKKAAVLPRMSLSLIEPRVDRLMKKMGLNLETILNSSKEELRKEVMKAKTGFDFKEASQTANGLTAEYLEKLEPLGLNPQEIKALRKVLLTEVKKTFGQARAREKEKLEQVLKNAGYLSDNLLPFGKRQERVFNIFYYMNLYGGKAFINRLYENYDGNRKTLEIEHG
ncbi:MAG: bacillithiol biosynthesis BshC, partial [bacterium]|nr:bacillithiol biosynthesis BshC [bacterium]